MNKKGFTLIELLAVIVILAVIALITVPAVMNVVSEAKQSAFKDSAYGIIKTAEGTYVQDTFNDNITDKFFLFVDGVMTSYPSGSELNYKGSTPLDGGLILHSDGAVTMAIHDGTYCAVKTKEAIEVTLSVKTKAECNNEILYRQASAPFNNLILNGDFSNGTTGWTGSHGTVSVSNKTLTNIANGGAYYSQGTNNVSTTINTNDKIYCESELKVYASATSIFLQIAIGSNYGNTIFSPIAGKWYSSSVIVSAIAPATIVNVKPTQTYVDAATAINKVMDVKNVLCINMTNSYGAGNEPTLVQMDSNLNKVWIDTATGNTPKRFTAGGWVNY